MFRFFFILILFLVLPDFLIWWNYTRLHSGLWRTALLVLPSLATLACMLLMLCQVRVGWLMQMTFLLFICITVPKIVFVAVALLGKLVAWNAPAVQHVAARVGIVLAVLMAAVQIFGSVWGWRHLVVERMPLKVARLPEAFKGYRLVHVSDLHLGTYAGDTAFVASFVDSVNACKPDMIVFTGDLVNTSSEELLPYVRLLSRLRATDGVYSVLGNHDYCTYQPGLTPAQQKREVQRIIKAQRMMGWRVLLNEHEAVVRGGDTLYVAGVENIGKPPFPEIGSLSKALKGIPENACTILLSHDPWHWSHGVVGKTAVPLTLSGHTHALQMQVGHFSPAQWLMPEWGGLYKKGEQLLYVSTGVGGSVPYRLGAWPKIEVLEL